MLKIDKDVPIPRRSNGDAKMQEINDALDVIEVGDSIEFALDTKSNNDFTARSREGARFNSAAKRRGFKIISRRNSATKTIRYWRVE